MWGLIGRPKRAASVSVLVIAAMLAGPAPAAFAQDDARLRKLESEIKALQRKVFPGGDDRFFQPEVSTAAGSVQGAQGASTSAVTDLLTRMDAIEAQLARLTGQAEENANRISTLETRAGIAAQPSGGGLAASTPAVTPSGAVVQPTPAPTPAPAAQANLNAMTGGASAAPAAAATPSASRLAAVRAIEKPQTDDPADDEYSYGFRLWEAGYYPEARQQLKLFVDKYPRHFRASWGRNLLGRAYLDDGQPSEAAKWFLENYQNDKTGGRAADSLLYLAASMKKMNDTKRACIAVAEFSEAYAAEAAGRLKGLYDATRKGLDCAG